MTGPPPSAASIFGRSAGVGSAAGTALWASLGVLDGYSRVDGLIRVAMLPSLATWLLLMGVTSAGITCLGLALHRQTGAGPSVITASLAPLTASIVLVVPYLPWLADLFPVLTVLAGPGRWIVWLIVVGETTRRVVRNTSAAGAGDRRITPSRLAVLGCVGGAVMSGMAAGRLTGTPLFPSGDEPHYLVIAQSLWRDGDLAIENNHDRGDYREYFITDGSLTPHYLTRGVDDEIYSVHPVGLPLVLAPIYALGGYTGVRIALVTLSALVGVALLRWLTQLGISWSSAAFAWLAVYTSAPFLFFTFTVYPEMLAGLTIVGAMLGMSHTGGASRRLKLRWAGIGAAAGWLLWLSPKYTLIAIALVTVALGRLWSRGDGSGRLVGTARLTAWLLAPFALSGIAWLGFFYAIWGSPWPGAPYGGDPQTALSRLPAGGL